MNENQVTIFHLFPFAFSVITQARYPASASPLHHRLAVWLRCGGVAARLTYGMEVAAMRCSRSAENNHTISLSRIIFS